MAQPVCVFPVQSGMCRNVAPTALPVGTCRLPPASSHRRGPDPPSSSVGSARQRRTAIVSHASTVNCFIRTSKRAGSIASMRQP